MFLLGSPGQRAEKDVVVGNLIRLPARGMFIGVWLNVRLHVLTAGISYGPVFVSVCHMSMFC